MAEKVCNVHFIGKGNTTRSIMAEGMLNDPGLGRFRRTRQEDSLPVPFTHAPLQHEVRDFATR